MGVKVQHSNKVTADAGQVESKVPPLSNKVLGHLRNRQGDLGKILSGRCDITLFRTDVLLRWVTATFFKCVLLISCISGSDPYSNYRLEYSFYIGYKILYYNILTRI